MKLIQELLIRIAYAMLLNRVQSDLKKSGYSRDAETGYWRSEPKEIPVFDPRTKTFQVDESRRSIHEAAAVASLLEVTVNTIYPNLSKK